MYSCNEISNTLVSKKGYGEEMLKRSLKCVICYDTDNTPFLYLIAILFRVIQLKPRNFRNNYLHFVYYVILLILIVTNCKNSEKIEHSLKENNFNKTVALTNPKINFSL